MSLALFVQLKKVRDVAFIRLSRFLPFYSSKLVHFGGNDDNRHFSSILGHRLEKLFSSCLLGAITAHLNAEPCSIVRLHV